MAMLEHDTADVVAVSRPERHLGDTGRRRAELSSSTELDAQCDKLADVARNWRCPYARSLLLAPATDAAVPGAVPDPPAPKWPPVAFGFVLFAEQRAVDVRDLACADGLRRTPVGRESTVARFVNGPRLVLAVRAQRTQLVQLDKNSNTAVNAAVKLPSKRRWVPTGARLEGPKLEPEEPRADVGFPDRRPGVFEHLRHSVWLL